MKGEKLIYKIIKCLELCSKPFNSQLSTLNFQCGQSLIEFIIAVAILVLIVGSSIVLVLSSFSTTRLSEEGTNSVFLAEQALEAVRSIKNQGWENISNGTFGLTNSGGTWAFSGTDEQIGKFRRSVTVSSVNRAGGDIVENGGILDVDTKKVVANVTWSFTPTRPNSVSLTQYITNWAGGKAKVGLANTCNQYQADCLFLNTSYINIASANRQVRDLRLYNTYNESTITIDKLTVSWTGVSPNRRMNAIRINGEDKWTGLVASGTEVDIDDVTLAANSNNTNVDYLQFNNSMANAIFTIMFKMTDGSVKIISGIAP